MRGIIRSNVSAELGWPLRGATFGSRLLAGSRNSALQILSYMEKRFHRDARLRELYVDFMWQYEDLGYMTSSGRPKIAITRVSSAPWHDARDQLFDKAMRRAQRLCHLERHRDLMRPNLLPALCDILLPSTLIRFGYSRKDVPPDPSPRRPLRFLEDPVAIQFQRGVPFEHGLACAPFLAMRTLK